MNACASFNSYCSHLYCSHSSAFLDAQASSAKQGSKHAYIIDVELICASCDYDTNECLNDGICRTDGMCECENGATGDWCQVQPTYNGHCDTYYNKHDMMVETAAKVHVSVQISIHVAKMNRVLLILVILSVRMKR